MPHFRGTQGSALGQDFPVGRRVVIGRGGDADIQLLGDDVSRQHACVFEDDEGYLVLMDLCSTNGTVVNGQPVQKHVLLPGDVLDIGGSQLVFDAGGMSGPSEEAEIRLMSGPAEDVTRAARAAPATPPPARSAEPAGTCGNPLHAVAVSNGWRHCPHCAAVL